jgi:3-carboxymuconate cyclase
MPLSASDSAAKQYHVYIGAYTNKGEKGIALSRFDLSTGKLTPPVVVAETEHPSFLTLSHDHQYLYAVNEVEDPIEGETYSKTGWVQAYRVDPKTGSLTKLNHQPAGGHITCYVTVDSKNRFALVANYSGGSIASLPVNPDGSLGKPVQVIRLGSNDAEHQRSRGHSIVFSPDERFVLVGDAGLDQIFIYEFDHTTGRLTPASTPSVATGPKSAPRHVTFHPNGKWVYNNNEANFKINSFDYDPATGGLTLRQTLTTLPENVPAKGSTAEVLVHPSGKFAYLSNRGPDSIAIYQIDDQGGLTFTGAESTRGKTPRNFRIDPTGQYLIAANQESDNIVVFRIDQKTGALIPTGEEVKFPSPVCIKFVPVK